MFETTMNTTEISFLKQRKNFIRKKINDFNIPGENDDEFEWIDSFFMYVDEIKPFPISRKERIAKKKQNMIIDFCKEEDIPIIYVPNDITKLESLDSIFWALMYIYKGEIPENHKFYELCKNFFIEWIVYYKGLNLDVVNKKLLEEVLTALVEQTSYSLIMIFKNILITKSLVKQIQEIQSNEILSPVFRNQIYEVALDYNTSYENQDDQYERYFKLGHISLQLQDIEKATEYFTQALGCKENDLSAREKLGMCYYYLGDIEQALEIFLQVYNEDRKRSESLRYICIIKFGILSEKYTLSSKHKSNFEINGVLKYHQEYLAHFGEVDTVIILSACRLSYELHKYYEVKYFCLLLLPDYYDNTEIIFYLADSYYHLGEYDNMLKYAFLHLSLEKQNVDLWFLLRDYYAQIGEYEISNLAAIIGTLYEGEQVIEGGEHLNYLNSLDLTLDDNEVYKYFMSHVNKTTIIS